MRPGRPLNRTSLTNAATGFDGFTGFIEEVRPPLHHDAALREVNGLIVSSFDFILRSVSELHFDVNPLVSHLIEDCGCQAAKAMARHLSLVTHPFKGAEHRGLTNSKSASA